MLQIKRILQLKKNGKSNRAISRETGVSRDTISEYMRKFDLTNKDYGDLLKLSEMEISAIVYGEPDISEKDWRLADLQERLTGFCDELKKPKTTRMILWEEYRTMVPDGYGYSQFCEYLGRYLEIRNAVMHFDHQAAAQMMFDFAGDKIDVVDLSTGEITKCSVLLVVLPFSAYCYVEAMRTASRNNLLAALNNALEYFGGVPRSAKTDNMSQVVKKSNRYEPTFDELFNQWALHYNTDLIAARVRKPRDKASVESHVNAIYYRIYAPIRNETFESVAQLNQSLWQELEKFNSRKLQKADHSRRERFQLHEKPLLRQLPGAPFVPKSTVKAKVQRNYHITLGEDMHHYSVPHMYLGKQVTVVYDTDNVEIYLGTTRIATHVRNYKRNDHSTLPEHRSPKHAYYTKIKGYDREYFTEKATLIGESTTQAIQKIMDRKFFEEQSYNSCLGVFRLGSQYGDQRLEAACFRAMQGTTITYQTIKNILEKNLDKAAVQVDIFLNIPDHDNIRGGDAYQ